MHRLAVWTGLSMVAVASCVVDQRSIGTAMLDNQPSPGVGGSLAAGSGGAGGTNPVGNAGAATAGSEAGPPHLVPPGMGGTGGSSGNDRGGSGGSSGETMGTAGTASPPGGEAGALGLGGGGAVPPGMSVPVPVTLLDACPTFDACGGELEGVWTYVDVCVEAAELQLDTLTGICPGTVVTFEPGAGAQLRVTGESIARPGEALGAGQIIFTDECTANLGGCSGFANLFGPESQCAQATTGCACKTQGSVDWGENSFSINAGQLSLSDGRVFDYCVTGAHLVYHETGTPLESGTYTLTRN